MHDAPHYQRRQYLTATSNAGKHVFGIILAMQFVQHGPDIPDRLLQAQEEGRVVFFCGAGISYPAGLPSFSQLVRKIYDFVGVPPNTIEQTAIKAGQFDTTIGLLEARIMGGREEVRRAVASILQPNLTARHAISTHEALLELAHCRNGRTRLITTNFDRLFEEVIQRQGAIVQRFQAPLLPVPKNRWDGLVYLHGLLPTTQTVGELDRLVLSSGDFGLAYLTERWAARFVSELFRNYTVCFVGYSINDPVLRYMMDALAADRLLGESPPEMFAFGSHAKDKEKNTADEWLAKNVTPILYREHNHHSHLHKTIRTWAATYRDGVQGKERIVSEYAMTLPMASTRQDNYVGRMLWALSHDSGMPAKRFAELDPAPSLDWLEPLSEERFKQVDLPRFGIAPPRKQNDKLKFSMICRPAPYTHAPLMTLTCGKGGSDWDDVMRHLARWLMRHLNDPALVLWLVKFGGRLDDQLIWLIECELDRFVKLEIDGNTDELTRIQVNSPNAIPGPYMRTLWRLLLTGRVRSPRHKLNFYHWKDRIKRDGMTATLRFELRELLAPKIKLDKPLSWNEKEDDGEAQESLKQLVDWELVLATDNVYSSIQSMEGDLCWRNALPLLIDDCQQLLRDALDLLCELGEADNRSDRSHWDLSSISPHSQNRRFRDWVVIIELLRDSWLSIRECDSNRATHIAQAWFDLPYSTFKRLAIYAASFDDCISPDQWVDWLVADNSWWLWTVDTQRETMRLLVLQAANLANEARNKLEISILAGPPRSMYRDGIEPERWQSLVDHSVWLYLAKLSSGGATLGDDASAKLVTLSGANPNWQLAANESDEFSHWMSGSGDPDYEEIRNVEIAPRKRQDLVSWLKRETPEGLAFYEDTWRDICRTRFFHSFFALCDLSKEGLWPLNRWRDALQAWSEVGQTLRSWRFAAHLVQRMPEDVAVDIAHSISSWLMAVSKSSDHNETILLDLCRRVLALPMELDTGIRENGQRIARPVTEAINHPVGHVTQALLHLWFKREPNDNDLLPVEIEPFFTQLCDINEDVFRHGRVLLASRLITLFRVDRSWTEEHLLPLFNWSVNQIEAKGAWEGFLWSPRLYRPLLIAFKSHFLDTAHHYEQLGEHNRQFAAFLTYAALDPVEGYTPQDFQTAIGALPQEGLQESARALAQTLEGAGEQCEDNWRNRILPFWKRIWPKARTLSSNSIAESLARLSIAARGEFPAALLAVLDWLRPIDDTYSVVHLLHESGLPWRFPEESLKLLDAIIEDQPWAPKDLVECLNTISQALPELLQDHRYQRLTEYVRRRGI